MKNTYLSISSAIAVFFFTLGFNRVASSFDQVCAGQVAVANPGAASDGCTSQCPCPDAQYLA